MTVGSTPSETDTVAAPQESLASADTEHGQQPGGSKGAKSQSSIETDETQRPESEAPTLLPGQAGASLPGVGLVRGQSVDRYVVLDRIGAGGMGVVVSAFDPDLDRKVAIKLLKPGGSGTRAWEGQQRLLREAQAMAKLSHPNVVTVHDVGMLDDAVFVAMEFVVGSTLRSWLRDQERPRREIIEAFLAAARGLAAAHAAGLVHRDFKPDNVMVGDDGQVRVMDFGLASVDGRLSDEDESLTSSPTGISASNSTLTRSGAVMGTPAYMSPEQFAGTKSGPATDQFALCVALYEALYGERPFQGTSMHTLAVAVTKNEVRPAPAGHHVPAALRKILLRGLAPEPDERWPSMDALISVLEDKSASRRSTYVLAAAGAVGLAGLVLAGRSDEPQPCTASETLLGAVWSPESAEELRRAYEASSVDGAAELAVSTVAGLDGYADRWVEAHADACEATRVRGEQSTELMDLRVACLMRRQGEFAAVVDVLAEADPAVIARAPEIVDDLAGLEHCSDAEALLDEMRPPEDAEASEVFAKAQKLVDQATARELAGQYEEALTFAKEAVELADEIDWPPMKADAYHRLGAIQSALGNYNEAENSQLHAFRASLEGRRFDMISFTALELTAVVGFDLGRLDDALTWAGHAEAATRGLETRPEHAMRLHHTLSVLHYSKTEFAPALQRARKAIEICERDMPEDQECRYKLPSHLASVLDRLGEYDEAIEIQQGALARLQAKFGADHPELGISLYQLATSYQHKGDLDSARRLGTDALEHFRRTLGEGHPQTAAALGLLSNIERLAGNLEGALDLARQGLDARIAANGPDHPSNATPHSILAVLYRNHHDLENAYTHAARVVELVEGKGDPLTGSLAFAYSSLADVLLAQERHQEALDVLAKAQSIHLQRPIADPSWPPELWALMGRAHAALGDSESAVQALEAAVADEGISALPPFVHANIEFELARNLPARGASQSRRIELAERALERFTPDEKAPGSIALDKKIRSWLAAQRR